MSEEKSTARRRSFNDLTGQRFGSLMVKSISRIDRRPNGKGTKIFWTCICDCGNKTVAESSNLTSGNTASCGCLKRASRNFTHRQSRTRLYAIWMCMKQRCSNNDHRAFADYGGRGIDVCDRWANSFENFAEDMGQPPSKQHTLDRTDNNKGYCKENCRWATWNQQARNRRDTIIITHDGQTKPLADWADAVGIHRDRLYNRLFYSGWSIERALTTPVAATLSRRKGSPTAPDNRLPRLRWRRR